MDPIVQVLIDRIEALAVDKAGLKSQLSGMRQDVQSAERQADITADENRELRSRNTRLTGGLKVIKLNLYGSHETLLATIEQALREVGLSGSDEGAR